MAVNVPNAGSYLGQVSQEIVNVRDAFQAILNTNAYIGAMGGAAFLTAAAPNGLGMSAQDAAALLAAVGNHAALAAIYLGGQPGAALNYFANGEPFWGGQ